MTAINHALTGAAIGLLVGEPLVAVPAALASHYVCDIIPHFKVNLPDEILLRKRSYRTYLITEATLCLLLVVVLTLLRPRHWLLADICAFVATSPDMLSFKRYRTVRSGQAHHRGWYGKFTKRIQWFERPIGWVVEATWALAALTIIAEIVR